MPEEIELHIDKLKASDTEKMCELVIKIAHMKRQTNALEKLLDARMIQIINETKKPIELVYDDKGNSYFFWLGHDKITKCRNVRAAMLFLLGLDEDSLVACLSSSAFKHGAFRKALKEIGMDYRFDEFFSTEIKDTLETGEKLSKKLLSLDTKFLK